MRNLSIVLLLAVSFLPFRVYAQDQTIYLTGTEVVGWTKAVHLVIDDQVEGNCWLNASAVESKSRLLLEQNGISVYQEQLAFYNPGVPLVIITANGERTSNNGSCYGSLAVRAVFNASVVYGGSEEWPQTYTVTLPALIHDDSWVMFNPRNFDEQISRNVEGSISNFIADIISARRDPLVAEMLPFWPNEPLTQAEWGSLLEGVRSE